MVSFFKSALKDEAPAKKASFDDSLGAVGEHMCVLKALPSCVRHILLPRAEAVRLAVLRIVPDRLRGSDRLEQQPLRCAPICDA